MSATSTSKLFAHLDPEIWLVTACDGSRRGGCAATSVANLSIVPELPRVALAIAKDHYTWQLIEAASAFALHLVGEEQLDWVWRFGLQSGRDVDKLAGIEWRNGASGSPILTGVVGWLDCRVETQTDVGDRTLYVAEVIDGGLDGKRTVLRWQRAAALATAAQRAKLKELRDRQAASDAALIRAWRSQKSEVRGQRSEVRGQNAIGQAWEAAMIIRSAKDLDVYRKAYELAMLIFRASQRFPAEEKYALTSQVRRSSRSVCMCLREAWAKRRYQAHFVSKLTDCDGENSETDTSLDFAKDCGYISAEEHGDLTTRCVEVGKMVGAMIQNPAPFLSPRPPADPSDF